MSKTDRNLAYCLIVCGVMGASCGLAFAQDQPAPDPKEQQQVFDSIDCTQWKLNGDGTWETGAKARVGMFRIPNTTHTSLVKIHQNSIDVNELLLKKCAKKKAPAAN